ncbi:NfeD family protein [Nonomuraea sp. SYSU D8015]|uniref:NfeD family protein n=1 Tax=Nonomuraea sp. SYSU D8015 TaxID=2593644 RepID=UPI0016604608|nr:nodulation protein NfeD [Nonomuraea sp. SYSU D8015]
MYAARHIVLVLLTWFALSGTIPGGAAQDSILTTRVDGAITPVVAEHVIDGLRVAERDGHQLFLVELDTPGGLDTSMRDIVQAFLRADVPVVVYVSPQGARAASAGAIITFAAHIAAMSPGTTIGAATPVNAQTGEKASDKVINDAAAYARTVAAIRGRNVDFAEATVRQGRSVTAADALKLKAIDLIAPSRAKLLQDLDGRQIRIVEGQTVTLRTAGAVVVEHEQSWTRDLLGLLADPNLAFLFISIGTLAVIYELASPGMGLGGVIGAVLLVLGLFSLSVLPVNAAGLALLALAAALFIAEVFAPGIGVFAGGGAIALLLAGLFLFEGQVAVSPAVLLPTTVVVAGAVVVAGRLATRAQRATPVSGVHTLVGQEVAVRRTDGSAPQVFLDGAWWTAHSRQEPLEDGQTVRVVAVEGLTVIVEPMEEKP